MPAEPFPTQNPNVRLLRGWRGCGSLSETLSGVRRTHDGTQNVRLLRPVPDSQEPTPPGTPADSRGEGDPRQPDHGARSSVRREGHAGAVREPVRMGVGRYGEE